MTAVEQLVVEDVSVRYRTPAGDFWAVREASLSVARGRTLAVVGESGSGKTTLARAILGLVPLASGTIRLNDGRPDRAVPAERIGMVWQDPFASLDPRWTVERLIAEPGQIAGRAVDVASVMEEVGLDASLARRHPHHLSGGQRQRIAIGRALALRPPLLICDEPTAALDLSIQAQILNLLKDIQRSHGCACLYISHDLQTVRFLADEIVVMREGRIVERGPTARIFTDPQHEYTRLLLASAPSLETLGQIPGL
ncbi:MAG: ATP-binding cassette domain-containing protein [Fimbriimonadaceae bacterium]|nr:ATP-binding cassette domain-containing protein [Fimbriimonadaceae bacterium]